MKSSIRVPEWKTLYEWNRYEISEEGQIRVRYDLVNRNGGKVLKRFWRDGSQDAEGKTQRGNAHEDSHGSLCVNLWENHRKTVRRIWKLMEKYWPGKPYPAHWKAERYKASPIKKTGEPDERFQLTPEQRQEIVDSPLNARELSEVYPVGRRYIHYLKTGK